MQAHIRLAPGHRLGQLQLEERVGQGSIGEVWRARHLQHDSLVAVKFLLGRHMADSWAKQALTNELRMTAGIHHPGIIQILDHGQLLPSSDQLSAPYLVMEWAPGGCLHQARGTLEWPSLRAILLQLVEALAYSHSRGVIHRDIKPSNVLLRAPISQAPPSVLLSDFGIGTLLSAAAGQEGSVAGTPAYMAPEQLRGHLYGQGPWTDLYALGCTAWALACGAPPFGSRRDLADLTHAQMALEPPPFQPLHPMPHGLEGWLRRMLHKDTTQRFTRAADAAYSLRGLGPSLVASHHQGPRADIEPHGAAITPGTTRWNTQPSPVAHDEPSGNREWQPSPITTTPTLPALRPPTPRVPPALPPRRWLPPPEMSPDLIRRRPLPLIGRADEERALWSELCTVLDQGRMRVVRLEGTRGAGCSHLAQWLCETAHRSGMATPLHGGDSLEPGGRASLIVALRRHLRLDSTGACEQESILSMHLRQLGPHGISEASQLRTLLDDPRSSTRSLSARERELLLRIYTSLTRSPGPPRPLILVLENARQARATLEVLSAWLDHQALRPFPVLVLLIGREDGDALSEDRALPLPQVFRDRDVPLHRIHPLEGSDQQSLLEGVLGLDKGLAAEIQGISQGHTAYAIQMVTGWIEEGELLCSIDGLKRQDPLAPIRASHPPEAWTQRTGLITKGLDRSNHRCLELAAVLGNIFTVDEWHRACFAARLTPSSDLHRRLTSQGLWVLLGEGTRVQFAHPMLRSSLLVEAQASGRIHAHHRACIRALIERPRPRLQQAQSLSRHLISSSQPFAALPFLRAEAALLLKRGDHAGADRALRRHAAVLEILPNECVGEQLKSDLLRAMATRSRGRIKQAERLLAWTLQSAQRHGRPKIARQAERRLMAIESSKRTSIAG